MLRCCVLKSKHVSAGDCADVQNNGASTSGVYAIHPTGRHVGLRVYCDLAADGGGWTVRSLSSP